MDPVEIEYLGKTDKSPDGDSPTAWRDHVSGDFLVQGYAVDEALVREELLPAAGKAAVPAGELVIRIPADMARFFQDGQQ